MFPEHVVLVFPVSVGEETRVDVWIFAEFLLPPFHLLGAIVAVFAPCPFEVPFEPNFAEEEEGEEEKIDKKEKKKDEKEKEVKN